MKKIHFLFWLTIFLFGVLSGYSQKMSFSISTGFGLPLNQESYRWHPKNEDVLFNKIRTNSSNSWERVNFSLGKGFQLGGSLGYSINEKLGIELGVFYLSSSKVKATDVDTRDLNLIDKTEWTTHAKSVSFSPGLVLRSGGEGKIKPFVRIAGSVVIARIMDEYTTHLGTVGSPVLYHEVWQSEGGVGFGFYSALGLAYTLHEKVEIFGELFISALSYSPKIAYMTEANQDGQDLMLSLNAFQTQIRYENSFDPAQVNNNMDSHSTRISVTYPFSSYGLKIGCSFKF